MIPSTGLTPRLTQSLRDSTLEHTSAFVSFCELCLFAYAGAYATLRQSLRGQFSVLCVLLVAYAGAYAIAYAALRRTLRGYFYLFLILSVAYAGAYA